MTHGRDNGADARRRALIFGALSLAVAGGTAATAWGLVARYERQVAATVVEVPTHAAVVADHALRPGSVIEAGDVRLDAVAGTAPADGFTRLEDVVGKTVADAVLEGEPVRGARLAEGGGALALHELVTPGHRAMTILASRAAAVGGLLDPGARVDVILTIRPEKGVLGSEWVAETILQGVRVLGVGGRLGRVAAPLDEVIGRDVYVTLDVDPDQAERLALASSRGQLVLSMRADDDAALVASAGPVATSALLGLPAARPVRRAEAPAPAADPQHTEVILGNRVTVERFDRTGRHVGSGRR